MLKRLLVAVALVATPAVAADLTTQVDVQGGRVKVTISDLPPDQPVTVLTKMPTIGVAPGLTLSNALARKLDDTGRVGIASPARFVGSVGSFDTLTRSEFAESLAGVCKTLKLDFALFSSAPQIGAGASTSAYIFGFGRIKQSQSAEFRLYECKTKAAVWKQRISIENSQGLWTNMVAGNATFGGGASDDAAAGMIASKLLQDLRW